jgi:glutamate/tyrosine decarboxylase-like PLP-dependent enzyme
MAHATLDMLIDLLADLDSHPALRRATPEEMESRLPAPAPVDPVPFEQILDDVRNHVIPFTCLNAHPRFFAFIPGGGTFPGVLGDLIASAANFEVSSWMEAAGPSRLEVVVIDWFKDWIGYPDEAAGVLVSGGSAANLTALACAREAVAGSMRDDLVIYASDQAHSSVARAARALGFTPRQLRVLPTDDQFRMRPDAVEGAVAADRAAGLKPFAVCASAGSTNTGAVDPLADLAALCREQGTWLHVDGAYGGFAAMTARGRAWLAGIEMADSVTLDPHKWLYQPFECGCLLVRQGRLLEEAFQIEPHYLKDIGGGLREVNFSDRGLQLSRMARSLKVWMSIRTFGVDAFRAAIDRSLDLALLAQQHVERSKELELMQPAKLGIICLRRRFGGSRSEEEVEKLNRRLVAALEKSGYGLVSSTRLRGQYAIRLCVLNHESAEADVQGVLEWLEQAEIDETRLEPDVAPAEPGADPHRDLSGGWATGRDLRPAVQTLWLFEGLSEEQLDAVALESRTARAENGEEVTTRWTAGREFHVILEGRAEVTVEGEAVRELGPGDFFGELAALDWGAGYGYVRTATVTAHTSLLSLVLPAESLNRLMKEAPGFAARIEAAVRERLPRT